MLQSDLNLATRLRREDLIRSLLQSTEIRLKLECTDAELKQTNSKQMNISIRLLQ